MISLIVAMDEKGGIGQSNKLLCHLPADLAFFKSQTMGKPMIMGRRTYQSIGSPLPGRRSIVLTHQVITIPGVEIAHSLDAALLLCQEEHEVMVIGGSTVYTQSLACAKRIYVTKIHHIFEADVFFPVLDLNQWHYHLLKERKADEKNPFDLTFGWYERLN